MKNFLTKDNIRLRGMQFFILIAHLVLLQWIIYTLYEGGVLPFKTLMYHFIGMSLYGGILIRFCAFIYQRQYLKELKQSERKANLDS